MTITGVFTAILVGIVVGVLGRLLVPGRQPIGMLLTVLVGIVSAFIGTAIARAIGIPTDTSGIDWLELLVQVIVAALGVALISALLGRRRTGLMGGRRNGLMGGRRSRLLR
ncbi:MAG TPA: GlsB/YeaQ/YmgE family stress response membrane protein [Mycobacterium sp.]|nr:GlsB/YeaQ/YmgE family stress response membrane protein [Mycobacterium sp.]